MFPKSQDFPTSPFQRSCLSDISTFIVVDLFLPPCRVRFRHFEVKRAAVPEAAVDKNTDFEPWKNDVRLYFQFRFGITILPKTQTRFVQRTSKFHLRSGFVTDVSLHHKTNFFGRGFGRALSNRAHLSELSSSFEIVAALPKGIYSLSTVTIKLVSFIVKEILGKLSVHDDRTS